MRIGLIGLGNMGAGMARNIRAAGFDLTVYDVREEAMAALERVGRLARARHRRPWRDAVDVVLTSLPGPGPGGERDRGGRGRARGNQKRRRPRRDLHEPAHPDSRGGSPIRGQEARTSSMPR
jgi:hypothetical protein